MPATPLAPYRDGFLAFTKVAAPGVAVDALASQLTANRTEDLVDLLGT